VSLGVLVFRKLKKALMIDQMDILQFGKSRNKHESILILD